MLLLLIIACIFVYYIIIHTYFRQSGKTISYNWFLTHCIQFVSHDNNYFMNYGLWESTTTTLEDANKNLVSYMWQKADVSGVANILDVGCGYGEQDKVWSRQLSEGSKLTAIDLATEQILFAMKDNDNSSLHYEIGDAMKIDEQFGDQLFDVILSLESAFHYSDRPRFFKNVNGLLKPGGKFVISDIVIKKGGVNDVLTKFVLKLFVDFLHIPEANLITSDEWESQLKEHLKVVEVNDFTEKTFTPYYTYFMTQYARRMRCPFDTQLVAFFCKYQPFEYKVAICTK